MFLGHPTHLKAKAKGENSMSGKRLRSESVVGPVPRDPRNMVKAGLSELQSTPMEPSHLPCSSLTHPAAILTPSIGVLRWIRAKLKPR